MKGREASITCGIGHQVGLGFYLERVHQIWGPKYDEDFQVHLVREMLCKLQMEKAVRSQTNAKAPAGPSWSKGGQVEPQRTKNPGARGLVLQN